MNPLDIKHKPIGGYFEWEFPRAAFPEIHPGEKLVLLNSGRHALEYILRGLDDVQKVFIPYYTCDAVRDTLIKLNVRHEFYSINANLQIADFPELSKGEYIIYTNYFGIKDDYVKTVVTHYKDKVIIDNAQALYCPPFASHQLYSPRKFAGLPDGGFAITSVVDYSSQLPVDYSFDRCKHLLKRVELPPSEGYADFKYVSSEIAMSPLSQMSMLSKKIFHSINWLEIKEIRRYNFKLLHSKLSDMNLLKIPSLNSFSCPMVYPFRTKDLSLREKLIESQIFVATYWPNVMKWCSSAVQEDTLLTREIIPLPIDQRLVETDIKYILQNIKF